MRVQNLKHCMMRNAFLLFRLALTVIIKLTRIRKLSLEIAS